MMTSIKDLNVVITGASSGIGRGIAKVFAAGGARLYLLARNEKSLRELVEEIRGQGGVADYQVTDVRDRAAISSGIENAVKTLGGLDVLCSNAGLYPQVMLETMTDDDWDLVMDTNAKGAFRVVQAALPALKQSKNGRIIITSSITGPIVGGPGWSHYGASKSALLGFVRTAALELAPFGITVNAVQPGTIATEGLLEQGQDYIDEAITNIPLKRLGMPEDVGHAVAFLASPEAGFITGQGLVLDGGQVLPECQAMIL